MQEIEKVLVIYIIYNNFICDINLVATYYDNKINKNKLQGVNYIGIFNYILTFIFSIKHKRKIYYI